MPNGPARPTVSSVVDQLIGLVDRDVADDLASEDPTTAVALHFEPLRVIALPDFGHLGDTCSTDGFYEAELDPDHPTIIFDATVNPARARFTIVHELGHHLFATVGAHLLDDLDLVGRSSAGAGLAEERACHEFAGRILIPDQLMAEVVGDQTQLLPAHLVELRARTAASWDAIAVRCVNWAPARAAVVFIRTVGIVGSSVSAPRLASPWWPRGSNVQSGGPLARAIERDHVAAKETYRAGLAFAEQLFCDTLRVNGGLAVCVLADRPSDGRFDILEPAEAAWKEREEFCAWDGDERDHGWCDRCSGRLCRTCQRCGCEQPLASPNCAGCGLPAPRNAGFKFRRTCVLDGRED